MGAFFAKGTPEKSEGSSSGAVSGTKTQYFTILRTGNKIAQKIAG
jgi:hypothetical protein